MKSIKLATLTVLALSLISPVSCVAQNKIPKTFSKFAKIAQFTKATVALASGISSSCLALEYGLRFPDDKEKQIMRAFKTTVFGYLAMLSFENSIDGFKKVFNQQNEVENKAAVN